MPSSADRIAVTSDNLRGLAHPLRVRLLGLLRTYGPATATSLAAQLDLTSGALSYHLRQLEKYGFIVEDSERGNRRDRWWRATHRTTVFEMGRDDVGGEIYVDAIVEAMSTSLARARAARHELPPEWQRVFDFSDVLLRLSPDEAEQLGAELVAVLQSYRQHIPGDPGPEGTRLVAAQFQIFPVPAPTATAEES
jgi:DNA-binding transcriptional ArsR family regulator